MRMTGGMDIIMFGFTFIQNGFLFCSVLVGLFCICHVTFRMHTCKNAFLIFSVITTGLCHVLVCAYTLDVSKNVVADQFPRGGIPKCIDISSSTLLANGIVFLVIVHNVIRRNFTSSTLTWFTETVIVSVILLGALKIFGMDTEDSEQSFARSRNMFASLQSESGARTDVFLSLCPKNVKQEEVRLLIEYCLVYSPVLLTVLFGLYKANRASKDFSLMNLRITDPSCSKDTAQSCLCTKFNRAFVSVLLYSFLVLFVVRPAMLIYSSFTSGEWRDVFPGLANTVIYSFLCGEYLLRLFKTTRVKRLFNVHEKEVNLLDNRSMHIMYV